MPIRNKRETLARGMAKGGIVSALERFARRSCVLVVTYHRIGNAADQPYYDLVFSATECDFADQIEMIKQRYRVLTMVEFLDLADSGFAMREPSVLITFDDGYRDNFTRAFPILRAKGVPATFFLPTAFISRSTAPWWDQVAYLCKNTSRNVIDLDPPFRRQFQNPAGTLDERIAEIVRTFLDQGPDHEEKLLEHVSERMGVPLDPGLGRSLFLSWDDARLMAASGMSFGSHSDTHRDLARLSEADQAGELGRSRAILKAELKQDIQVLAYPYGRIENLSACTLGLAADAGYRAAFSATSGPILPGSAERFRLTRVAIGAADSTQLARARLALYASVGRSFL